MSASSKNRAGGVLPINPAATRKQPHVPRPGNRAPGPKLRLIVRRLPPGLVESEFWAAMGEEWQVGKAKIEWAAFKDGKISKDPAKPSRPARAYLKVKDQTQLDPLSVKVKATTFQDARNSANDPCLLGPPSLEFAPYNKMATTRVRHDGRQGTIDQDQEFIDFLQSLTEPITKPATNGTETNNTQDKVTTTPLVQFLKEKKANKAKEAAEKKSAKQRETKETKEKKSSTVIVKGSTSATEKARVAKATQDAVRAINKSVASMQTNRQSPVAAQPAPKEHSAKKTEAATAASPAPTPAKRERERDRGNATAAARMLQRDLGLTPRSPRGARQGAGSGTAAKPGSGTPTDSSSGGNAVPSTDPKQPSTPTISTPPTGPRSARTASSAVGAKPSPASTAKPAKQLQNPSAGAKSAFLKHANPSQGVTEDLLRTAFEAFGTLTRCEIDKKKGLGYLDFEDTESLKKAMHASPVKVGNGQVVVLENRNVKKGQQAQAASTPATNTAAVQSPIQKAATPVPATAAASASSTASPVQTAATPAVQSPSATSAPSVLNDSPSSPTVAATPPTAPKGGGRSGGRGSARGNNPTQRGNFSPGARGNPRGGGFRGGGRGSFGPRGGRAAAQAVAAANTPSVTQNNPATASAPAQTSVGAANTGGGEVK